MSDDEFLEFKVGEGLSSPQTLASIGNHSLGRDVFDSSRVPVIESDPLASPPPLIPPTSRSRGHSQRWPNEKSRKKLEDQQPDSSKLDETSMLVMKLDENKPNRVSMEEINLERNELLETKPDHRVEVHKSFPSDQQHAVKSPENKINEATSESTIVSAHEVAEGYHKELSSSEKSTDQSSLVQSFEPSSKGTNNSQSLRFREPLVPISAEDTQKKSVATESMPTSAADFIKNADTIDKEKENKAKPDCVVIDKTDDSPKITLDGPTALTSSHKKTPSTHYEYYQDATGKIEKLKVYDDSTLPTDQSDDDNSVWQVMPTVGSHLMYDDKNNLLMDVQKEDETEQNAAASGYTRVSHNDDAVSINSIDECTDYLFDNHEQMDDLDANLQMAATKSMLTDSQKIAYAGLCRLSVSEMTAHYAYLGQKSSAAIDSLHKWGHSVILRLYNHLGLSTDEQIMIESLAVHNLVADDLTPCLRQVQKIRNGEIIENDEFETKRDATNMEKFEPANNIVEKLPTQSDDAGTYKELNASELHEELPNSLDKVLEVDVRWTIMCDFFLILIADGAYDARSRTLLTLVGSKLNINVKETTQFERKVTDVLQIDDKAIQDWTEKDIIENRRRKALRKKYAYVGLATVGGGLVIGLSGGLLAPLLGAGLAGALGTIGIAGTGTFLAGAGGAAVIATASTAVGATVGSRAMLRRAGHVKTFEFRPIFNNNRVNLVVTVGGWMTGKNDDVRLPFSTIDPLMGDIMSVNWEPEMMRSLGQTINILATEALTFGVQQILAATIFSTLFAALTAPMWLAKLSYIVDNPWSVSLDRAWAAGLIMADTLAQRKLGNRPTTLVGYGLGSRVIYSCLTELARRNEFGLVQDVYIFGTPVFYQKGKFAEARAVVSGRFINGYSRKDWILAFLFPAAKRYGNVLGLDTLPEKDADEFKVENVDVSDVVDGHMNYREKMPKLLAICGWSVLSEEFEEIEDPDVGKLREKQSKLLSDLYAAEKPKKTGIFSSWSFDWMQRAKSKGSQDNATDSGASGSVAEVEFPEGPDGNKMQEGSTLFDIDALQREMETLKPRIDFEQETMPLPEHLIDELPLELTDIPPNLDANLIDDPIKPTAALDYDDPTSAKPALIQEQSVKQPLGKTKESQVQLHFDDLP